MNLLEQLENDNNIYIPEGKAMNLYSGERK